MMMNALVRRTSTGHEGLLRFLVVLAILGTLFATRPALAQTVATVTVTANPTSLVANGTATSTITATVRDAEGLPLSGQSVSFQSSPTALGSLSSPTGITDASGQATVTFTAGTSTGFATVQARAGGITGSTRIRLTPNVPVPDGITLTANPTTIIGDNIAMSTIRAVVTSGGMPVAGVGVTFSTSHPGTFTPGGSGSGSATTNASGIAEVSFKSLVSGTALVLGVTQIGQVSATTEVTIIPGLTAIELTANPPIVAADGASRSTIQALVRQTDGLPVAGVGVSFSTTFGTLSDATATTNQDGIASVTLTSANAGSATVTGTAGSVSDTATVLFTNNSVTITAPAANAVLGNRRPTISGSATAGVGDGVRVFANGAAICSVGPQPDGGWTCTPASDLPEGEVLIEAELTQAGSAISPRAVRQITVDITPPAAPLIVSPAAGATTGPRPTITGTAAGEAGGTVSVTSGATLLCQGTVAANGGWICPVGADLASGAVTIQAAVTDRAGNVGPPASRSFTVDGSVVSAPTFSEPLLVNNRRPTIGGTAETDTTVRLTINLSGDASVVYENIAVVAGVWSVNLATATPSSGALPADGLADGSYPITAQARRGADASAITSATLIIDTVAPEAPIITRPTNNASSSPFPVLSGMAENDSTVIVVVDKDGSPDTTSDQVTYEVPAGAQFVTGADASLAGAWTLNMRSTAPVSGVLGPNGLLPGTQPTFTVRARDGAGNLGPATTLRLTIQIRVSLPLIGK